MFEGARVSRGSQRIQGEPLGPGCLSDPGVWGELGELWRLGEPGVWRNQGVHSSQGVQWI